ncbi:MAG: hypothetical protein ACRYFV_09855 [Janthinobacterium lividum]
MLNITNAFMAINLNDLQALLTKAEATTANQKEIRKSLIRIENLIVTVGEEVTKVYAMLDGAAPVTRKTRAPQAGRAPDPEAPFGRKTDGTPKKRPGRAKAAA